MASSTDILVLTYELKDKIINCNLYKELKEKEKEMIKNDRCRLLFNKFQRAQDEYNDAKRFQNYGSNLNEIGTRLSLVKQEVYNNEFIKEYNHLYSEMRKTLANIEKIIFKDIIKENKRIIIEE